MTKKTLRLAFVLCLSTTLSLSTLNMTGCGPSDPDESTMDRIPNVPPSGRGAGKTSAPNPPNDKSN